MTKKSLPTYSELRERPEGWTIANHIAAVRQAELDHFNAAQDVLLKAKAAGREGKLLAREQDTFDAHNYQANLLTTFARNLEMAPEANAVDYRQIITASGDAPSGRARHTGRGGVYAPEDRSTSWVKDVIAAEMHGDSDARERLVRNARQVEAENRALAGSVSGSGSELVPPAWLFAELATVARAGRVVADQVTRQPLPPATDSMSIPVMATGTAVAEQASQNTAIQNTDATTSSVTADVATLAGMQVVSQQLLDQSAVPVDRLILADLMADLAVRVDRFAISNNATNKLGLLAVSGTNTVTYTSASPTAAGLYPKIADAIQQIHTGRYLPPTKIFMHPRRWAWLTAAVDSTGRPLVVPATQMPSNAAAAMAGVTAEGFVGSMQGLPVYVDANIPTNLGGSTNEDRIIVARAEDAILWESMPRAAVLRERYADTLGVGLLLSAYVAFSGHRYPKSVSVVGGTGLATPTF